VQCDFLDYRGGIFSGGYYCKKDDKYLDKGTVNTYCDNSLNYRNCPSNTTSYSSVIDCYLTTAMCNILGYEDDCEVLETLRSFRDNYMKKKPECLPLLEDYSTVGPIIASKLDTDEDRVLKANIMLYFFIEPAINCIKNNDYDSAIEIYKNMTINLMETYDIDKSLLASQKVMGINTQKKRTLESPLFYL